MHRMLVLVLIHTVLFGMKKNSCRKGSASCLSRSQAAQTAVSDGGRFKGQAARVTHSGHCIPFH